ncbi:hypothetical protein E3C22_19985 [Jiella endophytica]|uniref:Uncharacterized protein n=1 Tax=Jiella endophytica TaxID=2558362 RepID=A0A4Y8RDN3_9HYPH|nr:hypothetical protein [Jiella endophytica]TFF19937.1 hypothetical protein E3C22_19985 [Jiella endophytica]
MSDVTAGHSHLIEIDGEGTLTIYRIFPDRADKQIYTSVQLPRKQFQGDKEGFERFARVLGENILMDSPQARDAFGV